MKLNSYKELIVWQKAIQLTIAVYKATENYPKTELYGLTSHTRRTAVSVPSNIAEGSTRQHLQEYVQHLNVALASVAELETQLIIGHKLEFLNTKDFEEISSLLTEVTKILNTLIRKLKG